MLSQLRVFLVALEEGSLNRAASRLRMSQSALSRQMQSLEHEIGGPLLERTTSGVRPTDVGHALAASVPAVLAAYDAAIAEARRLARGQRDFIRIGYLGSAAEIFLDPALAELRRANPGVKVKLLDLSPGEQIAALRKGELDLAMTGQEGGFAAGEFYTRRLATLPLVVALPDDHPLAKRRSVALGDLRNERFLSAPEADVPGRDRWTVQLCRRAGFRPRFATGADSISSGFSMINSEGAVALLPGYIRKHPASGVVCVEISDATARWDFLVVWQRGKASAALRAMLDALAGAVDSACAKATRKGGRAP